MMFILAIGVGWAATKTETFNFVGWQFDGASSWTGTYGAHTVEGSAATVVFASANKQSDGQNITDCPVTKGGNVTVSLKNMNTDTITGVTIVLKQWGTKTQTVTLNVSNDGQTFTATTEKSSNFSLTATGLSTKAVRFTFSSSSNQVGIKSIEITYNTTGAPTVAKPTISGTTPFLTSTEVTITAAEGAEIHYTTNGVDPTNNGNASYWVPYEGPFTITETTTVKAVAVLNNQTSDVATKTFTKTPSVASIDEFIALGNGKTGVFANPVTVIGQTSDKKYTYVQDGSAHGLLIYTSAGIDQAYSHGAVIPAGFYGSYSLYNGQHEMANPAGFTASTETATLTALELTPSQVSDDNFGRYAVIKGATISGSNITVGTESVALYDRFSWTAPTDQTKKYDIYGISSKYNSNFQFLPLSFEESTTPSNFTIAITPVPTEGQVYKAPVQVTITPVDASGEVEIQYTIDGSDPSASGATVYTGPFTIEQSATVKAYAVDDAGNQATAEAAYVIEIPQPKELPYEETFNEDLGDFVIKDVVNNTNSNVWTHGTYQGSGYAQGKGYINSQNHETESWLISPQISIKAEETNPVLTFKQAGKYFRDTTTAYQECTLWIREVGGQWEQLVIPYKHNNNFTFVDEEIKLTDYAGKTIELGFKYTSTETKAGTWEVKNFKIENVDNSVEYYLVGNFNGWQEGMTEDYKFAQGDEGYTLSKTLDDIANDGILFKIVKVVNGGDPIWLGGETAEGENSHGLNSGWHTDIPLVDGSNFHMTEGGNITFTVNITDNGETLTVDKEKALFIRGTFNEWAKQAMTKSGNNWTYEAEVAAGTEFKFTDEWGTWYGGNGNLTLGEEYALENGGGNNIVLADANTYTFTVDAGVTKLVVDGPFVTASCFKLVTSANELVAGKQYIIVGENTVGDETTTYTINTTARDNNRAGVVVASRETINGNDYIDVQNDMAVFVLGGEANAWTFYDGKQKGYLQSSNANSNYLYTKALPEGDDLAHAQAKIAIDEEGTSVVFKAGNRATMQFNYNGGNPPLFSCYGSASQKPVTLWVEAEKPEPTYNITIAETENGTVEADKETAEADEEVTLTIKPDEGYELDQLSVMCGNDAVEVSENNTFNMPAGNVTVTATFKAIEFNLTVTPPSGTYYAVQSATITAENMPDYASLVYVLNDGEETAYTRPVTINTNSTLIARVIGSTGNMLAEKTVEYTILIPTISVTPGPGTYVDNVVLTVDVTNMPDDGVIKYTLWDPEEEDFIESNVVYDDTEGIVIDQTAVLFVYLLQGNETLAYWGDEWLEDDDFMYTIIKGGTLEQVLAGESVDAINEDLHIGFKCADDGMVYAADAEGNWIGLHMNDQALAEVLASQNNVLKAGTVKGTAANLTTNPTYNVTSVPELIEGDAAEPVAVNMAANFSDVKGNTLVKISAYYKGEYFSAFQSDYEGQMLTIDNTYMNTDNLVVKQRYNVTGVLRLKGEWEAGSHPAPRKVGVNDSNYHDNMLIMPTSADIVTGVDDINVSSAVGVKYYNVAGVASDKPFDGMNIVVTRNADGTSTVTKVVF